MIQLTQFSLKGSFATARKATCKNCSDSALAWGDERAVIPPGAKRIILETGLGMNKRTLYLCPECAEQEAERLEDLARDIRRACSGWVDTHAEWEANRLRSIAEQEAACSPA